MSRLKHQQSAALPRIDRRAWLLRAAAAGAVLAGFAELPTTGATTQAQEAKQNPPDAAAAELEVATSRVRAVTGQPPQTATSDQYQIVGDASPAFMKVALGDCDQIAQEFL